MRAYLTVSATLFAILTVLHLARLFAQWPVVIAGWTVPIGVSVAGVVIAGGLSLWAVRLRQRLSHHA